MRPHSFRAVDDSNKAHAYFFTVPVGLFVPGPHASILVLGKTILVLIDYVWDLRFGARCPQTKNPKLWYLNGID